MPRTFKVMLRLFSFPVLEIKKNFFADVEL